MLSPKSSQIGNLQAGKKAMIYHDLSWGNRWRVLRDRAAIQKKKKAAGHG